MKPPIVGFNSPNANTRQNFFPDKKSNSSIPLNTSKNEYGPSGQINVMKVPTRLSRHDLYIETA